MERVWLLQHQQALLHVTFQDVLYTGMNQCTHVQGELLMIECSSFSGIGLGKEDAQVLAEKVMTNKKKKENWINTRVLIIDESKFVSLYDGCLSHYYLVSMVDGQLFDKIEYVARAIRQNSAPFGGLQVTSRSMYANVFIHTSFLGGDYG